MLGGGVPLAWQSNLRVTGFPAASLSNTNASSSSVVKDGGSPVKKAITQSTRSHSAIKHCRFIRSPNMTPPRAWQASIARASWDRKISLIFCGWILHDVMLRSVNRCNIHKLCDMQLKYAAHACSQPVMRTCVFNTCVQIRTNSSPNH